jgi:hypothetical protein
MTQISRAKENNDSIMTRFRVPRAIFRTLSVEAAKRDMKVTRFMIEILRATAIKIDERNTQDEPEDLS